jgi:penicillin-binding protein 1A
VNPSPLRLLRLLVLGVSGLLLLGGFALACSFVYLAPSLPTAENAQAVPLRVYTRTGSLICQIGEERSIPKTYEEIPDIVVKAVLAAEDDRFFEHSGIDWMGVTRALVTNVVSADATGQGGSTITQQAARNIFLTLDQTARRKLSEVFVTYRMERNFTKEQILAIYLNVATFGHRSHGIAAAAETYYGKHLDQLTVGEVATLIGSLPAPSIYNPISRPKAAENRRHYVLGRMLKLGYIDAATAAAAEKEPVATREYAPLVEVEAPYVCEMGRQEIVKRFGPAGVNAGYKVFTTIDGRLQVAANRALRIGLITYDRRHGYRGRLGKVKVPAAATASELDQRLKEFESIGVLQAAVVTKVGDKSIQVHVRGGGAANVAWDGLHWATGRSGKAADVLAVGDVVHVVTDRRGKAELAQLPKAQSALVALDPFDGAIVSLVGGFDFHRNNFNRAVQAQRQPGSGFKPFVYSAALENGFTPASTFLDAPLVIDCGDNEECWNPENSGGAYTGTMIRLRQALKQSLNSVSVRLMQQVGVDAAIGHAEKFGFSKDSLPRNLTLALGTQLASPLEIATGYATFANGGFKIESYFISRIEDAAGKVVFEAPPKIACAECEPSPVVPMVADDAALESVPVTELETAADATAVTQEPPAPLASYGPVPRIREVDAPAALRDIARNQGGPGYLKADRLAPRVISAQNAWLMTDILHDATVSGTAARAARELNRNDLAGKTGTSQNYRDNWFNGFTRQIVASVWVGFDDDKTLGGGEEGSKNALPIWIDYMREALANVPESRLERPGGLMDLRVSTTTGMLADQSDPTAVFETFMVEHPPKAAEGGVPGAGPGAGETRGGEPLF